MQGVSNFLLAFLAIGFCIADVDAGGRSIGIDDLIQVKQPSKVTISPDGEHVAYILSTPNLPDNGFAIELYIADSNGVGKPRRIDSIGNKRSLLFSLTKQAITWAPDSRSLVFVHEESGHSEIRVLDTVTGNASVLITEQMLGDGYRIQGASERTFRYSPDGRMLAFVARRASSPSEVQPLMHAIDASEDWGRAKRPDVMPLLDLFILELGNGHVSRATNHDYSVASFDWSPDSRKLALSLQTDISRLTSYYTTDIFVMDVASRELRPVVQQEGRDDDPLWSRDGNLIAFASQMGKENGASSKTLAIVNVEEQLQPIYIGSVKLDRLVSISSPVRWSVDGSSIDVYAPHDMSRHVLRVDVSNGSVERLTPQDDRYYGDRHGDRISYSRLGDRTAFIVQGVGIPPEVTVADSEFRKLRRLSHHNSDIEKLSMPRVERVTWRSTDDKWDLHGLLLIPTNGRRDRRYPLLTMLQGGPTMVAQLFNPSVNYPLLVMAQRGYAIFIPNTRGRVGYGMDFAHAIRDEKSYVLNPISDALSGIDMLIHRGVADPERLGVMGFSYGGTLTANIITHSDRFKAAIYGEGSPDLISDAIDVDSDFRSLYRDLRGLGIIFEPSVFKTALEESAIFRLHNVKTPVMLESGAEGSAAIDRPLFRGLRYFGIPSIWRIYPRSGHGWDEPLLVKDAYTHHIAWFDYWILDKPYPNSARQSEFDSWKRSRMH